MTEAVVRGTFIELVAPDEKSQPMMGRSKSSTDKVRMSCADAAVYVHTDAGWQRTEEDLGEDLDVNGVEHPADGDEAGEGRDELDAATWARGRTTTESSDGSLIEIPRCSSSKSTCLSVCVEDPCADKASALKFDQPSLMAAAMASAAKRQSLPQRVATPPLETVCVHKTFIEVNSPDHSSGDDKQPCAQRSKTSGEVRSLLATSSSSLPLYVNDGTCWRKAEDGTAGSLPVYGDDLEDEEEVGNILEKDDQDLQQQSIWRMGTSSSGAWEVAQGTLHSMSFEDERDLDAAQMVADAVAGACGADVQPQAVWRSLTSSSGGWEALQEHLATKAPEQPCVDVAGQQPGLLMRSVGSELRRTAQFAPEHEVCTFHADDDHEDDEGNDEEHGQHSDEEGEGFHRVDRPRAKTESALHPPVEMDDMEMRAVASEPLGVKKLTPTQRTNRRRSEKRRQRRVCAELDAQSLAQAAERALAMAMQAQSGLGANVWTTVTLRSLPSQFTRSMLLELLDSHGFRARYDFVYLPLDFQTYTPLGFAFVNFRDCADAMRCFEVFQGFRSWAVPSPRECVVAWCAENQQGLASNIERYRNTSLMHASVAEERKPLILVDGVPCAFPAPTRRSWRTPPQNAQRGPAGR